ELGKKTIGYALHLKDVAPKHWTPTNPNLYRMVVSLKSRSGELLDRVTHDVGFRTFEVRGNQLHLNRKPYWLRGADHLPYGKNPWNPELPRKLIRLMHDGNQRVTRTHATPWSEAWLNAADEIGLGVSIEGIRPWALVGKIGLPPKEIFQHWLMEHEDVVRRCRNHPSVLIWTIGNEMLLRDRENVEKWKLLSEVVKLTRRLDPSRPTVCSSTYQRDPEFYERVLKPNGIDDGDLDDIHRYNGWYGDSNFVQDSKFEKEMERNRGTRPFIGQEMSSGYPNLDDGLPVAHYTRELAVPQAWVGYNAYPGSDPAVWLKHHRAVTKRWAEQLRFQRGDRTAGFMMFAAECWYSHSYDPDRVDPYPVYEAMQQAWAPVGLALKTARRRFHAGEELATSVFVTNDDEQFRDHADLTLQVAFVDEADRPVAGSATVGRLGDLAYYRTAEVPVRISMPEIGAPRQHLRMVTRLLENGAELSRTVDLIELLRTDAFGDDPTGRAAVALSLGPELRAFIEGRRIFSKVEKSLPEAQPEAAVVLLGPGHPLDELAAGGPVRRWIENGATAVVFSPGEKIAGIFPSEIGLARPDVGEYADPVPVAGTKLTEHLEAMDLKWWGRKDDERAFVAGEHYLLADGARARELIRFIPSHGYISEEKVPGMFRTVLCELRLGRGRLWVCGLDLEASVSVDPAAALFARNLLRAAADPRSTDHLPEVPSLEQMMAGTRPSPRLPSTVRGT
ncbi:MAG TPA: glycoside hydrolase family 2 TIM barrel-domain containing protein, partial [Longimicrobiaceae bacterium]|nr:glycoside hydrolase family 2 TIM barrel-domain containing protein [Longimicrobiaceae bacterium]